MNKILSSFEPIAEETIPSSFTAFFHKVVTWMGRTISPIRKIPHYMHNHPSIDLTIFLCVNAIFFLFTHSLANFLENRVKNTQKEMSTEEVKFNQFLINGLVIGGLTLTLNICLKSVIRYSLSNAALIVPICGAIALHILVNEILRLIKKNDPENRIDSGPL